MDYKSSKIGFTLLETIIAITLFMLVVMFLYGSIDNLKNQNQIISKKVVQFNQKNQFIKVLFLDIFEAKSINIKTLNKNIDTIQIITKHSLYHQKEGNVSYVLGKDENKEWLIRKEKGFEDKIKKVKVFKVYKGKKGYFVYIDGEYFEVLKLNGG